MPESYDVVVIGGGVVGSSVAFHLARLGCRSVALLERGEIASGATSRSSGVVRTHYSIRPNAVLARAAIQVFRNFPAELEDEEAESGFTRCGYLIVAPDGEPAASVRRTLAMQRAIGIDTREIDAEQARALHPLLRLDDVAVVGYEPDSGYADPYLTTTSFARAARRKGARVFTGRAVTGLLRRGARITGVRTAEGDVGAGTVVSAINVWTRQAAAWAGVPFPLEIAKHRLFSLRAPVPYTPRMPVVKDLCAESKPYYRAYDGGTVLVGAGDFGDPVADPDAWDQAVELDYVATRGEWLARRMPVYAGAELVASWAGVYDVTPDWNPVLGPVPGLEGIQIAYGFSGHGFKLSPVVGRLLAQSVLGLPLDHPIEPYRITRFAEHALLTSNYGTGSIS